MDTEGYYSHRIPGDKSGGEIKFPEPDFNKRKNEIHDWLPPKR